MDLNARITECNAAIELYQRKANRLILVFKIYVALLGMLLLGACLFLSCRLMTAPAPAKYISPGYTKIEHGKGVTNNGDTIRVFEYSDFRKVYFKE